MSTGSQVRMIVPLNNNRSNRRRGRGNNRSQGGNQLNRIDSRARGNAPQLLEKYKKLAHDASLNGDRVQTEYYLQFADHYFRVLADTRVRQDEQRFRRDEPREQAMDFDDEDEFASYGADRGRSRRPERDEAPQQADAEADSDSERGERQDASSEYEPVENPFTRGNRERAPQQRRQRKPRAEPGGDAGEKGMAGEDAGPGLESILPPAIGARGEGDEAEKPARRRRAPRAKPTGEEGGDEALQKAG